MAVKLINPEEVPPGGFRYRQAETGMLITASSWRELVRNVIAHRRANSLPVGLMIEQEIVDQLCSVLPAGVCCQDIGTVNVVRSLSFADVKRATYTLFDWWTKDGLDRVTHEEASERVRVCAGCPYNQRVQGCGSCAASAVRDAIVKVVGKSVKVEGDHLIEACAICGCSLKALIWLPTSTINRHEDPEMLSKLPAHCWHKP